MIAVSGNFFAKNAALLALFFSTSPSGANEATQPRPAEIQQIFECRLIVETRDRLNCYDAATEALNVAEQQGRIFILDQEQITSSKRALFGFNLSALPSVIGGDSDPINEIDTTLQRANHIPGQGWTFHLEDGSTWRQIDSTPLQFRATPGLQVRIRRAAMGSYLLKVADYPAVRAKRQ